jgi:hypothetical protein
MAVQISTNGSATPAEAAAIAAAVQQFEAETAPAAPVHDPVNRWQRAALLEGVDHAPRADVWGSQPSPRI